MLKGTGLLRVCCGATLAADKHAYGMAALMRIAGMG